MQTLSEHASKQLLAAYGIPIAREVVVDAPEEAERAAGEIGYPVVLKLCGDSIAHKSERNLVRLGLWDAGAVRIAAYDLWDRRRPDDGPASLLVAELVDGRRELIAGVVRDLHLGPCVMLGLGGVLAEALDDVVFAVPPITAGEARRMIDGLRTSRLFSEPFRGEPPVDLDALGSILVALGRLALDRPDVVSVDVNPLIVQRDAPIAVDGLVVIDAAAASGEERQPAAGRPLVTGAAAVERFQPLFHPRGIIVAGVSTHPGKFGFVAFHNLLRFGFQGELFPVSRGGGEILGRPTFGDVADVPRDRADLVFVCTPREANIQLLRACRDAGARAAFIASGGYGEAGADGAQLERELVEAADQLGLVLAGPNGQGVVSTSPSMCAQIVSPYPPAGRIAVVSQSGNIVSSLSNYAVLTGVGVSKSISCGNAAQTTLADYFAYFAADPETAVTVAYLEGVADGSRFVEAVRAHTRVKPLVMVKGGAASEGQRAAASHTGSLATNDRIFDGLCRQLGAIRAPTVEEAFEWAATFATQPLPRGRRTVVFTSAGGWGVLAADACAAAGLQLVALPDDVRDAIDAMVPARWSRNNPIDLAGGETRDTIPEVLDLLAGHAAFDAIVHLGIGIQANQANAFRTGAFYPDFGLDRIVEFHERQDGRYAEAACAASARHDKPVLVATELVHTDRAYGNAGPLTVRRNGRLCYPSAHRAVRALRVLVEYAEYRRSQ
jgi:acyl-CoA synthetase (NDP forming)